MSDIATGAVVFVYLIGLLVGVVWLIGRNDDRLP